MTSEADTIEDEPAAGRGRPRGRRDAKPRAIKRISAVAIIKAAGEAGFAHCSIDTDGKITVQMSRPADQAGQADDKGDNEWDAKRQQWLDRAGQE